MKYLITNETYSKAKAFKKGITNMLPLLEYIQNFMLKFGIVSELTKLPKSIDRNEPDILITLYTREGGKCTLFRFQYLAGFIEFARAVGFEDENESAGIQTTIDFIYDKIMEITELHTFKEELIPDIIANIREEDFKELLNAKKFGI